MKISAAKPSLPTQIRKMDPKRKEAKEVFDETEDRFEASRETHSDRIRLVEKVTMNVAQVGFVASVLGSLGGPIPELGLNVATRLGFAMTPGVIQLSGALAGAVVGVAAVLGVMAIGRKVGEIYLNKTTGPEFQSTAAESRKSGKSYYEALITEMDDDAVRVRNEEDWETAKAQEFPVRRHANEHGTMSQKIREMEHLADERLLDGWSGDLARHSQSPYYYGQNKKTLSWSKSPEGLLEVYKDTRNRGISGYDAVKAVRGSDEGYPRKK